MAYKVAFAAALALLGLITVGAKPAPARSLHISGGFYHTRVPSHWLLDRNPRVITVPQDFNMGTYEGPAVVVSRDYLTEPAAVAKARAQQIDCAPVRISGDINETHRALGCAR